MLEKESSNELLQVEEGEGHLEGVGEQDRADRRCRLSEMSGRKKRHRTTLCSGVGGQEGEGRKGKEGMG